MVQIGTCSPRTKQTFFRRSLTPGYSEGKEHAEGRGNIFFLKDSPGQCVWGVRWGGGGIGWTCFVVFPCIMHSFIALSTAPMQCDWSVSNPPTLILHLCNCCTFQKRKGKKKKKRGPSQAIEAGLCSSRVPCPTTLSNNMQR